MCGQKRGFKIKQEKQIKSWLGFMAPIETSTQYLLLNETKEQ